MNHTACRDAVAYDEIGEAAAQHLDGCEACREFANDVRRLEGLAAELVPTVPLGLADRVFAATEHTDHGTVVAFRPPRHSSLRKASRSLGVRLTATAAALLLVAGLLTMGDELRPQTAEEIVLASADATAEAGTADVRLRASTTVVAKSPRKPKPGHIPQPPNFGAAPAELRPQLKAQWTDALRQFERQLQAFSDQLDANVDQGSDQIGDALREMQRQLDRSLRPFGGDGSVVARQPRRLQPRPRPTPPQPKGRPPAMPPPPRQVSTRVQVEGQGQIDFARGAVSLRGDVATASGTAPFELAADTRTAVYRDQRQWARLPRRSGPLGGIVLDAAAVLRVVRSARGVTAAGAVDAGGEQLARYTFDVPAGVAPQAAGRGRWGATVLVDADGRLRRVELVSRTDATPAGVGSRTRVELDLSGHGQAPAPPALPGAVGHVPTPEESSMLLYPFNEAVRASQRPAQP